MSQLPSRIPKAGMVSHIAPGSSGSIVGSAAASQPDLQVTPRKSDREKGDADVNFRVGDKVCHVKCIF